MSRCRIIPVGLSRSVIALAGISAPEPNDLPGRQSRCAGAKRHVLGGSERIGSPSWLSRLSRRIAASTQRWDLPEGGLPGRWCDDFLAVDVADHRTRSRMLPMCRLRWNGWRYSPSEVFEVDREHAPAPWRPRGARACDARDHGLGSRWCAIPMATGSTVTARFAHRSLKPARHRGVSWMPFA